MPAKVKDKDKSDDSRGEQKKKKKRLSLESDDDDDVGDNLSVEKELERYLNEPKLSEDSDPLLDFWKKKETEYPRLSILAQKYLCVQATSTPSERIFSKMGNVVSKKRNKLTPSHTNETIFLSCVL